MGEIIKFSEIERYLDICTFSGTLEGKFANSCFKTQRTNVFEERINILAREISKKRKYLVRDYTYDFLGDSLLVDSISVPCFGYWGAFEMASFSKNLILESEGLPKIGSSDTYYFSANIPLEEACTDVTFLMKNWADIASEFIEK